MPSVPKVIDRDALRAALQGLGVDIDRLRHVSCDAYSARLTYLALNEQGKPFAVGNGIAEVTYEVPIHNTDGTVSAGRPVVLGGTEG